MTRCIGGLVENQINRELGGLMIYARDLLHTPFGFLVVMMHFATSVAGKASALPDR